MKNLSEFDIVIFNLKDGSHRFDFELNDEFFEYFGSEEFEKGQCEAVVTLEKSERLIVANFVIKGTVQLLCDRSLEPFDYPIAISDKIMYKFGSEERELSEDLFEITLATHKINVAQFLYEFVAFEIPMKKLHPKFKDEEDDGRDVKLVYKSASDEEESDPDDFIDPRWLALKNLSKGDNSHKN